MSIYLSIVHNYPTGLFVDTKAALTHLIDEGPRLKWLLTIYPLLFLLLIPGGLGSFLALKDTNESSMRVAGGLLLLAMFAFMISALRWPGFNYPLAEAYVKASASQQQVMSILYVSMNRYFGLYVNNFLGNTFLAIWIIVSSIGAIRSDKFQNWIGYFGIITGLFILSVFFANADQQHLFKFIKMVLHIPFAPIWFMCFGLAVYSYKD